jgi:hypothetical protein
LYRQCGDDAIPVKTTVQKKDYGACSRYELETEDVTGFEVAGFVGEAAHPERDSAMVPRVDRRKRLSHSGSASKHAKSSP